MTDATSLLLDLVAIPSVSHMNNLPVIEYVEHRLDARYWDIRRFPFVDAAGTPKSNLLAITRNARENHAGLALVCHTDTVPFDASWEEAVHPVLRDGRVYGRGSCDVKGFLACALTAIAETDLLTLTQPLALILTADEEVGCAGAKRLTAEHALRVRRMIIGEPTSLRPVRAGKGYALGIVTIRGKEAHSAFPSKGRSAIFDAARVIGSLEALALELEAESNPDFEPPFTTLNVGLIEGGRAKNVVAGECRLTVEWRPIPGQDPLYVANRIRQGLAELRKGTPGLQAELDVKRTDPPFNPSESRVLAEMMAVETGNSTATISFGSEAAHLAPLTEEAIVFGPGDMTVAHKTGEFVPVIELDACVRHLKNAIRHFCI